MPSALSSPTTNSGDLLDAAASSPSSPPLSREEHLSMEHLTRSEVFAKKPPQCLSSNGDEIAGVVGCNNDSNVELPFTLLPGEYARWYSTLSSGILITLTNYRLFVLLDSGGRSFYNIPIQSIDTVECKDIFYLQIACKDGRMAKIAFENNESCLGWLRLLNSAITVPAKLDDIFAFAFYAWCKEEKAERGLCLRSIDVYLPSDLKCADPHVDDDRSFTDFEFSRLEFDPSVWRITELNSDYRFCSTYPKFWIVPASIGDQEIESAGRYRSLRRVPSIVWRHRTNGAVLVRCSQPESGIFGWRSPADEKLLHAIVMACNRETSFANGIGTTSTTVPSTFLPDKRGAVDPLSAVKTTDGTRSRPKNMLILDARSYTAAWANRAKGGGFESTEYYQNCEIQFLGLANIHGIRYSFQKLRSLCWESLENNWFQNLDACQWVNHLCLLLASAVRVAEALHVDGRPVLVHCSDGWDRTTQIISLAKLFLDPHYRTMKGFKELIEREWIAFGHKFAERSGTTVGDINQRAPVFLQWLDCVHYVLKENPCSFEFNETYLVKLAQHVYSGLFGTFLCNSMADYVKASVASRTFSIWSYLHPDNRQFRNVLYTSNSPQYILPRFQLRDLADVWRTLYCPSNDPANIRPRTFSTTSMDGDNPVAAGIVSNQAASLSRVASNDKSLARAHSCDNLVSPPSQSTSAENLCSIADRTQGFIHRSGSDSSLSKVGGAAMASCTQHVAAPAGVERDTEQLLRSLVDLVEKSAQTSIDSGRAEGLETSSGILNTNVETCDGGNGAVGCPLKACDEDIRPRGCLFTFSDFDHLKSNTASAVTMVDQETRGMDVGTSTTDLSCCCDFSLMAGAYSRSHACRRHGFFRDLNERPLTTGPEGNVSRSAATVPLVRRVESTNGQQNLAGIQKVKPSPKDMIDPDGMTQIPDVCQQRIREMMANYEKRLECLTAELEITRFRLQHQNGYNCVCADRKKLFGADEYLDEPHSFGSRGSASDTSWDKVEAQEAQPVRLVPDHFSNRCMRCDSVFTIMNRRHHCRCCGWLVCNACSSQESTVPDELLYDLVRVCNWCYTTLRRQDSPSSHPDTNHVGTSPTHDQDHSTHQPHHKSLPQEKVSA